MLHKLFLHLVGCKIISWCNCVLYIVVSWNSLQVCKKNWM